ncbi:DMT family transporter [Streptomyces griseoviridis]|uniref:DMT family transporter n=1 Tax=Streptomyces griseoviridis TaxID=45398 RepID=UPI0033EEB9D0
MSALALSVLLSFVSAVAYAGGAIVQEHVAVSSPGEQYAPLRRPTWWAAVALNGLGGLLHVVALAYGPLSLVQPLGALTIVFALPMAALFVGRRAGATAWRGAVMATVGLAGLLSLVGASDGHSLSTPQRVAVAVVSGGGIVALMLAARVAHRHPAVRSMLLATGAGVAFGMASVFTKTVAVDWTGGVATSDVPSLALIAVFATAGMLLSQASYRGAGLAAPLATLTVVNPVVAAAVGITMFGETFRHGTLGTVLALGCGVVAAGGLILLTTERLQHTGTDGADGADGADDSVDADDRAPASDAPARAGGRPLAGLPAQSGPWAPEGIGAHERITAEEEPPSSDREPVPAAALAPVTAAEHEAAVLVPVVGAERETAAAAAVLVPVAGAERGTAEPVRVAMGGAETLVPGSAGATDAVGAGVREGSGAPPSDDEAPDPRLYRFYGPFYGGTYVPLPSLDRHRVRVRS